MPTKYPNGMRSTQWRRTPFRIRHRLLAFAINNALGHWRSCADRRCHRARGCQNHECYWRRLEQMTYEEQMRMREAAATLAKLSLDRLHQRFGRPAAVLEMIRKSRAYAA
jgi:hypothetical protein